MSHYQHHSQLLFRSCGQHAYLKDDTVTTPEPQSDQIQGTYAVQVHQVFAWIHNCQHIFDVSFAQHWTPFAQLPGVLGTH